MLKKDDLIKIVGNPKKELSNECIYVNYKNFCKDLSVKDKILIDDGDLELEVVEKKENKLIVRVKNSGKIKGRKSVNFPGVHMNLPSLSKRDKDYIEYAIKNKLDFIAHSFVRDKKDLMEIQKILDKRKSKIKIISKIENQEGVENIDEILDNCYGVMIARGDLGIEIPAERLPIIQRKIIEKCIENKKPVIVATQMLHTMIKNPRPTRAEISDIANAVYLGADAIMLSGETTVGDYPLEAVKIMTKVSKEIEKEKSSFNPAPVKKINKKIFGFITKSAVRASLLLPVKAIITDTNSGRTARELSAYRG
ncbi:MAG: pyruvate kinase, partial [Nanoarchaeota archaeon]